MTKALGGEFCTVAFAAERLGLHPKTVLRFIRDSRLKATRIGKSYRIRRADLAALAGVEQASEPAVPAAWVTAIVQISAVDDESARRFAVTIPAALKGRQGHETPMRADVIHDAERAELKIVLVGGPGDVATMLRLIEAGADRLRGPR
jgi:excisionase family DNA binding protein